MGKQNTTGTTLDAILKLCSKVDDLLKLMIFPYAHRTSNMIDRHMEPMARFLYSTRYFHGHMTSAEMSIRAWALTHNFLPYCPRAKIAREYISPAHKLNGFVYHENWLQNLLVSASMGGCFNSNISARTSKLLWASSLETMPNYWQWVLVARNQLIVLVTNLMSLIVHGSYESLAADPDVDVVYIGTPHPSIKRMPCCC